MVVWRRRSLQAAADCVPGRPRGTDDVNRGATMLNCHTRGLEVMLVWREECRASWDWRLWEVGNEPAQSNANNQVIIPTRIAM